MFHLRLAYLNIALLTSCDLLLLFELYVNLSDIEGIYKLRLKLSQLYHGFHTGWRIHKGSVCPPL